MRVSVSVDWRRKEQSYQVQIHTHPCTPTFEIDTRDLTIHSMSEGLPRKMERYVGRASNSSQQQGNVNQLVITTR